MVGRAGGLRVVGRASVCRMGGRGREHVSARPTRVLPRSPARLLAHVAIPKRFLLAAGLDPPPPPPKMSSSSSALGFALAGAAAALAGAAAVFFLGAPNRSVSSSSSSSTLNRPAFCRRKRNGGVVVLEGGRGTDSQRALSGRPGRKSENPRRGEGPHSCLLLWDPFQVAQPLPLP